MWIIIGVMYLCVFCGRERKGFVDYVDIFYFGLVFGLSFFRKLVGVGR